MDNKEIIDEISRLNNKIDECLKGLEILASGYKLLTEIAKDVCQISEDNFKLIIDNCLNINEEEKKEKR